MLWRNHQKPSSHTGQQPTKNSRGGLHQDYERKAVLYILRSLKGIAGGLKTIEDAQSSNGSAPDHSLGDN